MNVPFVISIQYIYLNVLFVYVLCHLSERSVLFVLLYVPRYYVTDVRLSNPPVANQVTLGWLFNNMSADHEEVHVPVKKLPPKQAKLVVF